MSLQELLAEMTAIVEKNVEYYKTDFYDYDVKWLKDMNGLPYHELWIVRDSGTHLACPYNEYGLSVLDNCKVSEIYLIHSSQDSQGEYDLREISEDEARLYIKKKNKSFELMTKFMKDNLFLEYKKDREGYRLETPFSIVYELAFYIFREKKLSMSSVIQQIELAMKANGSFYKDIYELADVISFGLV